MTVVPGAGSRNGRDHPNAPLRALATFFANITEYPFANRLQLDWWHLSERSRRDSVLHALQAGTQLMTHAIVVIIAAASLGGSARWLKPAPAIHFVAAQSAGPAVIACPGQMPADSAELVTTARRWLALVDSGQYAASLDSAAPLLRQMAGSADAWRGFVGQARAAFPPGAGANRVVTRFDAGYMPTGAPPGRYVLITFRIGVAGATHPEFVVLQETATGWRVAMYGTSDP